MNSDRFAALVTPVGVMFMKSSKPQYCLASRKLNSIWVSDHKVTQGAQTSPMSEGKPPVATARRLSIEHLICLDEDGWRHGKAEGFRRLQVDGEEKPVGSLHRQVCRLGPFQDF